MSVIAFPESDDARARQRIRRDLDATLVVEAAAGTGKTTELVNRILQVLTTGRALMAQIVAVTFTEKAAGELKLRLRERLEQERSTGSPDAEVRQRLDAALETLEEAHVNTIHGFCAELLRERPVEARVDPLFSVLTEPQAAALYDRAFGRWLEETLQSPPEGVRRALRRTSSPIFGGESEGPVDRLRNAGRALADMRDFAVAWRRPPFARQLRIERLVDALHELADLSAAPFSARDNLYADLDAVRRLSGQIALEQSFGVVDLDGWEARLVDLVRERGFSRTRKGSGFKYGKRRARGATGEEAPAAALERDVTRPEVLAARDTLFADLQQFRKDADADLAAALQQELIDATARYQDLKAAAGTLDFTDLLARTRELIRSERTVREHLQRKFTHIFVDEFQDTDPVQAEILLLLSADDPDQSDVDLVRPRPGKLFIVGDPKQAIYRFRGTDVATYWRVGRQIVSHGGEIVQLTTSFRGVPELQAFVNRAFSAAMVESDVALQARYMPLTRGRDSEPSQPALVALPIPRPYGHGAALRISPKAIEESTPAAVGAFVAWLVDEKNGWTVAESQPDGTERRVPIRPSHIAILFRRFTSFGADVTRAYTDAIEAHGIPHLLVGGKSFHGREEVETVRAALSAVEWPDDELSVFATLKGALFAFDDELLFEYGDRFGRGSRRAEFHPFRIPAELGGNRGTDLVLTSDSVEHLRPIAEALRLLQELHRRRNYRPVADTITTLLERTRAHVGLILRAAGEQALANVLHVAELARQYEAAGGISFRGFIDHLNDAAASEGAEAPILEESSDGVRLMTVHKAKGLEFPVVILADPTCRMSRQDASRYLDLPAGLCAMKIGGWAPHELHDHEAEEVLRDEAEGVRLAYVAATRARDLLVVPAVGDEPWDGGWFSPLNAALYPPLDRRRTPERGPKCPVFRSKDSVLERPNGEPASHANVAPGLHRMSGGYPLVWWDPHALDLKREAAMGLRREELIIKDVPRAVVDEGRTRYERWRTARAEALERSAKPSLAVISVREWTLDPTRVDPDGIAPALVAIVDLTTERTSAAWRSGGSGFGMVVHAVLARAGVAADIAALTAQARIETRLLGLDETIAEDAAAAVERVLRHPLLARARTAETSGRCRRETPITWTLDDGTVLEGVVDLAFEEGGTWHVVDFKTDRELDLEGEARYRRQVAIYAAAIARATGQATTATILRT